MHYGTQSPVTRYNGKCKRCEAKASVLLVQLRPSSTVGQDVAVDDQGSEYPFVDYCVRITHECSGGQVRNINLSPVRGVYNPGRECDARCMSAIGHDCECRCGGRNHGAGHSIA